MYRAREKQMSIYAYLPPYHGELCNANRWVRLADAIDWDGFEKAYSALFAPGGKVPEKKLEPARRTTKANAAAGAMPPEIPHDALPPEKAAAASGTFFWWAPAR